MSDSESPLATFFRPEDSLTRAERKAVGLYYHYDAHAPLNVDLVQQASSDLLELDNIKDEIPEQKSIRRFVEALSRVRPYLIESEQEVVDPLLQIWQEHQKGLMEESELEKAVSASKADGDSTNAALLLIEKARQHLEDAQEKQRQENQQKEVERVEALIKQDFSIIEDKFPYSAWSLRESPQERLIAAARYMENLHFLKNRLKDEPMLIALRPDAMQVLAHGDTRGIAAAKAFLNAYEKHLQWERENPENTGEDRTDHVSDMMDDLAVSDVGSDSSGSDQA